MLVGRWMLPDDLSLRGGCTGVVREPLFAVPALPFVTDYCGWAGLQLEHKTSSPAPQESGTGTALGFPWLGSCE